MLLTENQIRKLVHKIILTENKLKDFVGNIKVYDYDKDRTKKPKESEIIVKVDIKSTVENAEGFARGFGEDNGYRYTFKKHLVGAEDPDPISPKEGYFLFSK